MDSQFLGSAVEMLILQVIAQGPSYGYEITQTVSERSNGYFELKEGSLYPALHRLERQKWLRAFWREADGRRRKYYELTDAGRAELAARKRSWLGFAAGVNGVLGVGRAHLADA
jgi:PadR family transcriptional regulator, regulatory protein PadR